MKKMVKLIAGSVLGLALLSLNANAGDKVGVVKGKKAFQNKLSVVCGMDSENFAGYHNQEDWLKIKNNGNFVAEIEDICEKPVSLSKKDEDNIFKYVFAWGADSGKITTEEG